MTKTEHYQLNQWDASDYVRREDFNDNFEKIDKAIATTGNCNVEMGTYVGDGTYGEVHARTLTFSFVPKIILITKINCVYGGFRALFLHGCTAAQSSDYYAYGIQSVTWDDTTKSVTWYSTEANRGVSAMMNDENSVYLYAALG